MIQEGVKSFDLTYIKKGVKKKFPDEHTLLSAIEEDVKVKFERVKHVNYSIHNIYINNKNHINLQAYE